MSILNNSPFAASLSITFAALLALTPIAGCGVEGGDDGGSLDGGSSDGTSQDGATPDAGATDSSAGDGSLTSDVPKGPLPSLFINEICAKGAAIEGWNPTGSDWIELYNAESSPLDLSGYRLIDSAKKPASAAFALPKGTKINAKGFLVIYFNHDGVGTPNIDKGLSGDEAMSLFFSDGRTIDVVNWEPGDASPGKSWGRSPDGSGVFMTFDNPSPAKPNGT